MGRVEFLKESLAELRFWLGLCTTIITAIVGWVVINEGASRSPFIFPAVLVLSICIVAVCLIKLKISSLYERLKNI